VTVYDPLVRGGVGIS